MDEIDTKLQFVLKEFSQVIVWGAGQLAMKLLAETSLAKASITAFVDGNPINQGKLLFGTPVLGPEQIRGMEQPIIVTSILHKQSIANIISNMDIPNRVIFLG